MSVIRKVLWGLVIILALINESLWCWHQGYNTGYFAAMSDVVLGNETPENFFIKKFDIKTPHKVQLNQEHE